MEKYSTQVKIFMRRFNCACVRLKKLGQPINVAKRVGYTITSGIDVDFSKAHKYYVRDIESPLSPFALLLFGVRISKRGYPIYALEEKIGLQLGMLDCFVQGFTDAPAFRDVWQGLAGKNSETNYWQSLMFNLGRAFLGKFSGIVLPYNLPTEYCDYFKQLN